MTKEEYNQKAEEYLKDESRYLIEDNEGNLINITNKVKQAYIAGAIENGIQWHDLRKNPNDLPFKMGIGSEVVLISYDGEVTDFAYYNFELKRWEHDGDAFYICDPPPVAWCEIPKFEEVDK